MADVEEQPQVTYEELAAVEDEFEEIDTEIMRKQYILSQSAYAKRAAIVSKIPNFWPLVLERAPQEIDQFINPADSQIFAENLTNIEVTRPEVAVGPEKIEAGSGGNPRSIRIRFDFKPNDNFDDSSLEKTFWFRRASDGWTGLVSEPVKIHWKKGKDLTEGLTDMAVALFEERKKSGDMLNKGAPAYTALKKKLQTANGMNTSFFTWFGYVSARRYITAKESEEAEKAHAAKKAQGENGKAPVEQEEEEEDMDEKNDDAAVEVHEAGDDIAIAIADDLWPGAIKYFTEAQEMDEMSDIDFEEMEDLDDQESDDDEAPPLNIKELVQESKGGKSSRKASGGAPPPSKKQKK